MDAELQAAQDHHTQAAILGLSPVAVLALIFKYGPGIVHAVQDIVGHFQKTVPQPAAPQSPQS